MSHHTSSIALILLAAGCAPHAAKPDDRICSQPKQAAGDNNPGTCVQVFAYQFARAPGTAKQLADAVVFGCENETREFVKKEQDKDAAFESLQKMELKLAEFSIVQARAGRCEIPPKWKAQ